MCIIITIHRLVSCVFVRCTPSLTVLSIRYPKELLPPQFWSSQQKADYQALDMECLREHYLNERVEALKDLPCMGGVRGDLTAEQVADWSPMFRPGRPADLERLPRHHLKVLAASLPSIVPHKKALLLALPTFAIRSMLTKAGDTIRYDDASILEHGTACLTAEEALDACLRRGIPLTVTLDAQEARRSLDHWLQLYKHVQQPTAGLLLHASALMQAEQHRPMPQG
ncbi:unnamed protein product [Chrysoparadoxa australica]